MSFTESQQKIIDYVSTDELVKNDFLKAQNDLKGYDEQRTPEKKQNELWKLAQEYFECALDNKDKEAEALQQTYQEIIWATANSLKSSVIESQEQKETPPSRDRMFEKIKQSPAYDTIASFVAPEKNKAESEPLMKERCNRINTIRWKFALGTLPDELKQKIENDPEKTAVIENWLSLFFMDWLNHCTKNDLKQIADIGWLGWLISKASDLMKTFTKLTSFKDQVTSINTVIDAIDIHSSELLAVDSATKKTPLDTMEAFSSPEWFYRLLTKHTPKAWGKTLVSDHANFHEMFDIEAWSEWIAQTIIDSMSTSYTPEVHAMMNKVQEMWPKILDTRSELQKTFGTVYEQLNNVAQMFGEKSLATYLKDSRLWNVADFVCALLGFWSLKQIERKWLLKEYNKNCPERQRKGMEHAMAYVSAHNNEEFYKNPNNPLVQAFTNLSAETYTEAKTSKEAVVASIPDEKIMKDSVLSAIEHENFFVHPQILAACNINISEYFDGDGKDHSYRLKEGKQEEYKKIVSDNIDKICTTGWKPLLEPWIMIDLVAHGKTQTDIATLCISWLSFPDYAVNIVQDDLAKAWSYAGDISKLVGYGKAQQELLNNKKVEEHIKSLEELEKELADKQKELKDVQAAIGKTEMDKASKDTEELKKKAKELSKQYTTLEKEIKKLTQQINELKGKWQAPEKDETHPISPNVNEKPLLAQQENSKINTTSSWELINTGKTITKDEALSKYWNTPAVRNFNPWNITDTSFWWKKLEWERFTTFETPQEWINALIKKIQNIQEGNSKTYWSNPDIRSYITKYAPPSENSTEQYIKDICKRLWCTEDTKLKDIDAEKLAIAHAEKEDGKSYQMLKDLDIVTV